MNTLPVDRPDPVRIYDTLRNPPVGVHGVILVNSTSTDEEIVQAVKDRVAQERADGDYNMPANPKRIAFEARATQDPQWYEITFEVIS